MKSHSIAVREAKSRQELENLRNTRAEYGVYSEVFDRKNADGRPECVDRYVKRGIQMPSASWTREFVNAGGSFDSCGSWGITPVKGIELEHLEIPADFCGKMLKMLGRADYDYQRVADVYRAGINPEKRAEFHATVWGIARTELVKEAKAQIKSLMRFGWMEENKFNLHILKTSQRVGKYTSFWCFNGVNLYNDHEKFLVDRELLKNSVFADWVAKRPSKDEMQMRREAKEKVRPVAWIEKVPPHLQAVALRQDKAYFRWPDFVQTSVGEVHDCEDGKTLVYRKQHNNETAVTITGRKIRENLSLAKVSSMWFVWNPMLGFQRHMENASLKEAVRMWENRSQKGEPRPLSLNDVRNDVVGTSGFCLTGTKGFLENRMPFVFRLIQQYKSWNEIPEDIMSIVWDVDFKIFQGYSIP